MGVMSYRGLKGTRLRQQSCMGAIRVQKGVRDQCVSATRALRLRIRPNLGV